MNLTLTSREYRTVAILTVMGLATVLVVLFSLTIGAISIPVVDVAVIILQKIGLFGNI